MKDFTRTITFQNPDLKICVNIKFDGERLSITGDIYEHTTLLRGPWLDVGSGQCQDELVANFPKNAKAQRLYQIWERWHLNDMCAGCEHQQANWNPSESIEIYTHKLDRETISAAYDLKRDAEKRLEAGETVKYTPSQLELVKLPYTIVNDQALPPKHYTLEKCETKAAGWVNLKESPRGLLGKPCEVCSYKYGSQWRFEKVPTAILKELRTL